MDLQIALISGAIVIALWLFLRRPKLNLPPPVPGLPILGNTLQVGSLNHMQLDKWKYEHGPIYSLNTLGAIIVVVTNAAMASDILDKMSAVTSCRPDWIMASELMTRANNTATQKHGDKWRKFRRGTYESLHFAERFAAAQENEALILVRDLIAGGSDSNLEQVLRRWSASIIWRETYGGPPLKSDDKNLLEIERISDSLLAATSPGGSIVDIIPPLNYLPTSLAPFKQYADKFFARANALFLKLAENAIEGKLVHDDASKLNFCAFLNERKESLDLSDEDVAWISGVMFLGSAETSSTAMHNFVLAMILHPHVRQRAQKELDAEIGDRPPRLGDRDRLPYIEAIVKETLRWRPVVATGVPHVATEDFSYKGYTIPKGAIILGNLWSITHDPELFENPDAFMPERFLDDRKPREPNVRYDDLAFGYGRRICVGRQVALNSLFINMSTLLWAFDFDKGVDAEGRELTPSSAEFLNTGSTVRPKTFPFKLAVRSPSAKRIVDDLQD